MGITDIILLGFSFLGFFISVLFFFKGRGDKIANKLLAFILFMFSHNVLYYILSWTNLSPGIVSLNYTDLIPISLYGALFYFYVKRVAFGYRPKLIDLIHLIPLLSVIYVLKDYLFLSMERKIELGNSQLTLEYVHYSIYHEWILVGLLLIYAILSFRLSYFNEIKSKHIKFWVRLVSLLFLGFSLSFVAFHIIYVFNPGIVSFTLYFMVLFIGTICYVAFMQPEIFNGRPISEMLPFIKYGKTGLTEDFSAELKEKLLLIMEKDRPYLDSNIRLQDIADLLDISRHHASQVINVHYSVNFFDFINQYRVREAERLLTSTKSQLSITDIAFKSGFNNRISFYKAFKKITGITPSEYREQHLAS